MKTLLSAAVAAACLLATPAFAAPASISGSVGVSHIDVNNGPSFDAVTARLGTKFVPYVGVEAEGSIGFDGGKVDGEKVDLRNDWAVYLDTFLPMTDNVSLVGRVGYGSTKVSGADDSFDGVRYGAGIEAFFDDANGVRIDYTRFDNDHINADAYTISYVRKLR
jgi:hypothetical protein